MKFEKLCNYHASSLDYERRTQATTRRFPSRPRQKDGTSLDNNVHKFSPPISSANKHIKHRLERVVCLMLIFHERATCLASFRRSTHVFLFHVLVFFFVYKASKSTFTQSRSTVLHCSAGLRSISLVMPKRRRDTPLHVTKAGPDNFSSQYKQ